MQDILGVDVSKNKLDLCLILPSKERHKVFSNDFEGFIKAA